MKAKPVVVREAAAKEIGQALDRCLQEGGAALASGFVASLERVYRHLRRYPATGALRYANELGIAGQRFWPLDRFPYLIFYFEREDCVDVLLMLHAQRDIAPWLQPL